jgi:hypothetical protein
MFAVGLYFISILASLYLWGIVRTAAWILITVLLPESGPLFACSLLSFWIVAGFIAPYRENFFDLRNFYFSRWLLIFLSSGILAASLINPYSIEVFLYCTFIPLGTLGLFYVIRHPATPVLYLKRKTRVVLLILWIICAALRLFENHHFRFIAEP